MRSFICFALLFLFCAEPLLAQVRVYPVKVDHQWGYMNRRGRIKIEPRYDAISPPVKLNLAEDEDPGFQLVELAGRIGVINRFKQEVLPCSYDFVEPLNATRFLVRNDGLYMVVDSANVNLLNRWYPKLEFAATINTVNFYRFIEGGKVGLLDETGRELLPANYAAVYPLEHQLDRFAVEYFRPDGKPTGLLNLVGADGEVFSSSRHLIKGIHPTMLLISVDNGNETVYQAVDREGEVQEALETTVILNGTYLSDSLVQLKWRSLNPRTNRYEVSNGLYSISRETFLASGNYESYISIDQDYIGGVQRRFGSGSNGLVAERLDVQGQAVDSSRWFNTIEPYLNSSFYLVGNRGRSGLMDTAGNLLLQVEYQEISLLKDSLAQVRLNGLWGLINYRGELIIPASYDWLERDGMQVAGRRNDNGDTEVFQLDTDYQVESITTKTNRRSIRMGQLGPQVLIEARAKSFGQASNDFDLQRDYLLLYNDAISIQQDNHLFAEENSARTRNQSRIMPTSLAQSLQLTDQLDGPIKRGMTISTANLQVLYTSRKAELNPLGDEIAGTVNTGNEVFQLADLDNNQIWPERLIGIRALDAARGLPSIAAINPSGQFMLVDTLGKPRKDEQGSIRTYTFIGDFKEGIARACVGGQLQLSKPEESSKRHLITGRNLMERFLLTFSNNAYGSLRPLVVNPDAAGVEPQWGVIDTLGNWVIPPKYAYLDTHIHGQMVAEVDNKFGVINTSDSVVIPFQFLIVRPYRGYWRVNERPFGKVYFNWRGHEIMGVETEEAGQFVEGICAQKVGGQWRFVNEEGQLISDTSYVKVSPFGEGLAAVSTDSLVWNFIDAKGELRQQLANPYTSVGTFVEGRCMVQAGNRFGFIDTSFQEIVAPAYRRVWDYQFGLARVANTRGIGLIDTAGNIVLEPGSYRKISAFSASGIALAHKTRAAYFLIDTTGQTLHDESIQTAIIEGHPPYPYRTNNRWGFVDGNGQIIIKARYLQVRRFHDGVAAVKPDASGRWYWIDTRGKYINDQSFLSIQDFSDSLALVAATSGSLLPMNTDGQILLPQGEGEYLFLDGQLAGKQKGKKVFYTDLEGNLAFPGEFTKITPFAGGITAIVEQKHRKGIIDQRGMLILKPKYFYLIRRADGTYEAGPPAFGIYDRSGKCIIPPEFDEVSLLEGDLFRLERGEQVGYMNATGEWVWPLQN